MTRIVLITGTRKGLGKALAEHYLRQGDAVIGCSRGAGSIVNDRYSHYELDVADENAVVSMVRSIRKEHGKIDVLLNNAGIASMNHTLTTPFESVSSVFSTNVYGTFLFTREVSKVMMKRKSGRIVNYTTVASPLNLAGEAVYVSSKAAVEAFTKVAAKELASYGIRINAIGPTPILTDLIKTVPKDKINALLEMQSIPRLGQLDDVINVIDFFVDERSEFITGQMIYLGGVSQ